MITREMRNATFIIVLVIAVIALVVFWVNQSVGEKLEEGDRKCREAGYDGATFYGFPLQVKDCFNYTQSQKAARGIQ